MKILFVIKRSGNAGLETLLIRIANFLCEQAGVSVNILFITKGYDKEFFALLSPKCHLYSSMQIKDLLKLRNTPIDQIYAFDSIGLLWFLMLKGFIKKSSAKLCLGVYHAMEYYWEAPPKSFIQKVVSRTVDQIPNENILFMNEGILERFNKYSERNVKPEQILPLPIDTNRFKNIPRTPKKGHFVSVGRLVDFKTYNLNALTAIKQMRDMGFDVRYDVYGDGELASEMLRIVSEYKLEEHVKLHGAIPYKQLESVFQNAHCFIGVGTALLEAAAAGIPGIVGTESVKRPLTTGFFNDSPGSNVGEYTADIKLHEYRIFMEKIMTMSDQEYKELSDKHIAHARKFSIEGYIEKLNQKLEKSKAIEIQCSPVTVMAWFFAYFSAKFAAKFGMNNTLKDRYVAKL